MNKDSHLIYEGYRRNNEQKLVVENAIKHALGGIAGAITGQGYQAGKLNSVKNSINKYIADVSSKIAKDLSSAGYNIDPNELYKQVSGEVNKMVGNATQTAVNMPQQAQAAQPAQGSQPAQNAPQQQGNIAAATKPGIPTGGGIPTGPKGAQIPNPSTPKTPKQPKAQPAAQPQPQPQQAQQPQSSAAAAPGAVPPVLTPKQQATGPLSAQKGKAAPGGQVSQGFGFDAQTGKAHTSAQQANQYFAQKGAAAVPPVLTGKGPTNKFAGNRAPKPNLKAQAAAASQTQEEQPKEEKPKKGKGKGKGKT